MSPRSKGGPRFIIAALIALCSIVMVGVDAVPPAAAVTAGIVAAPFAAGIAGRTQLPSRAKTAARTMTGDRAAFLAELETPHAAGRLLVQLRRGNDLQSLKAAAAVRFGQAPATEPILSSSPAVVLVLPPAADLAAALVWLTGRAEVAYAEPDYTLLGQGIPDDPLYASDQQYLDWIHAPDAWDMQTGDPHVVVAVLDSGVDSTHPDLAPNLWTNPAPGSGGCGQDVHGCNFVAPSASGSCPASAPMRTPDISPLTWHGTFVAGVIGAKGNNGQGVAGVAWNVSLMPVRVLNCRDIANTAAFVTAVHYAVDQGARVINVGAGSGRSAGTGCRASSQFIADAVQYARDHGVLVVAGAGNENKACVSDPAASPGVLAVGGFMLPGPSRWLAGGSGSNWGPEVGVAAPASKIVSTMLLNSAAQPPNDRYGAASGTSAAAPIVAGEAALLLSQNSWLSADWLETLIELGAQALPDGDAPNWAGAGSVDLAASLRLVPAGYAGTASEGGQPAPDGALVEGYVGSRLCAQASAYATGGAASTTLYTLLVPAAAMQPGCGAPGAAVDIRLDGVSVAQVPWTGAAHALDLNGASTPGPSPISTVAAAPSITRVRLTAADLAANALSAAGTASGRKRRRRRPACVNVGGHV